MRYFVVDFRRTRNRLGNLLAEDFPEPLAQPVNGNPRRPLRYPESAGDRLRNQSRHGRQSERTSGDRSRRSCPRLRIPCERRVMVWSSSVRAQRRSYMLSALDSAVGSIWYRVSATDVSKGSGVSPPPRFSVRARSHSLAINRFTATMRKVRNRPFSRAAERRYSFCSRRAKNSCVRSWASWGDCPWRRTKAYTEYQ